MFDFKALRKFKASITPEEVMAVLKYFEADKSPGPDGWTPDFFLHFIEYFIMDLTDMVEESRVSSKIIGAINSTFIAFIPKNDNPSTFGEYRPISLCNLLYKITSKIIANRMKLDLSKHISPEQYGFLPSRSIHDAIAVAQDILHSIHSEKREEMILKVDLYKAYDTLDWSYIRLVLLNIGLPLRIIRWIMSCITSVRYAVIVNGLPTTFFEVGRGL